MFIIPKEAYRAIAYLISVIMGLGVGLLVRWLFSEGGSTYVFGPAYIFILLASGVACWSTVMLSLRLFEKIGWIEKEKEGGNNGE